MANSILYVRLYVQQKKKDYSEWQKSLPDTSLKSSLRT